MDKLDSRGVLLPKKPTQPLFELAKRGLQKGLKRVLLRGGGGNYKILPYVAFICRVLALPFLIAVACRAFTHETTYIESVVEGGILVLILVRCIFFK